MARILPAQISDMRNITDGWFFNWKKHFYLQGANAFKLITGKNEIQGLLIFQIVDDEPTMAYLESAPGNCGKEKKYDYVAGCLIAFACQLSHIHGKDWHQGFLSFQCMDEKVIKQYHNKYGAERINETYMLITPEKGIKLIDRYLERSTKLNQFDQITIAELKHKNFEDENEEDEQHDNGEDAG